MFGMGFMEILLIAVIAIIALGPEKLPTAMVEIAKFIKKFKSGVDEAKTTLNTELNISEMKAEANKFKAQLEETKTSLSYDSKIDLGLDEIIKDDLKEDKEEKNKNDEITFKEEKKKEKKIKNKANKFKVNFDEEKEGKA